MIKTTLIIMRITYLIDGVHYLDTHMAKRQFDLYNMQFHRRVESQKLSFILYQTKKLYREKDLLTLFETTDKS